MPERPPQFFAIPADTREAECRSCGQAIYWIRTANDRPMPCSIEHEGAYAPTEREPGSGISHFIDCPHANQHRKRSTP